MADQYPATDFGYSINFRAGSFLILKVGKAGIADYEIKEFASYGNTMDIGVEVIDIPIKALGA